MANPMVGEERMEAVKVSAAFPEALIKVKEYLGDTFLCIRREFLPQVITLLKEDPDLEYNYFSECVGVDYSTWNHARDLEGRFEVVYNLMSLRHSSRIFVKVSVNDGETVPTLKHIFQGAEFPEREIWDLYGVIFEGHEQTDRFLLPDDWVGHPLRKDFPLGGEDVLFDQGTRGPAVEDKPVPHAGESFSGKTGTDEISGR